MARVKSHDFSWTLPPAATHGDFYAGDAADAAFLAEADAGSLTPFRRIPAAEAQEVSLGVGALPVGTYQFAVVAEDAVNGKFSDAVQSPKWVSIPLDLTALAVPTNLTYTSV